VVEADKKVKIRIEVNNSLGVNGTQYTSDQIVLGYKHLGFTKDGSIKTEVMLEQLTVPVETVASATVVATTGNPAPAGTSNPAPAKP